MEILKKLKPFGIPTAVALGYFDGVHIGHQAVIRTMVREAKARETAAVVLTFDMHARRAGGKGGADLLTYAQRAHYIEALGADAVLQMDFNHIADMSADDFVAEVLGEGGLGAEVVCCGADFRFGKNRAGDIDKLREDCYETGIDVLVVGEVEVGDKPASTTAIKEFVRRGEMEKAVEMLGHSYGFTLPVCEDKKLARRLGFPTINQRFPADIVVPRFGVYASRVILDGRAYAGVTNLGVRPTVESDGTVTLETHILGFEGELYGRQVHVELGHFLRDERRFESVGALRAQVTADIAEVEKMGSAPAKI